MDDQSILSRIESLVQEEHTLIGREGGDASREGALEHDRERLQEVSVQLDRCWDLLRQRRALRGAGRNPDDATARDAETVEHYWQ
ncbi:MAG TPA: DUF2630 family protein [Solirubrobacteraceae bacterium]|nr:DUF2630 family protein [Solirubrobacteraceae bacterium]